jgi:hypothetical protein
VAINARAATGNKLILSVSLTPSKSGSGLIETDPQVPVGGLRKSKSDGIADIGDRSRRRRVTFCQAVEQLGV